MDESLAGNLIVVGGERYWHELFPAWRVTYGRLQTMRWILQDHRLHVADETGLKEVHGVLWRVGVVRPEPWHRAVLDLIRISGVPCINSAESLLRGFDKLSMTAEMASIGLPVLASSVAVGAGALGHVRPAFPSVLKIGNHHGGLGKARVTSQEQWDDLVDVAALMDDYAVVEPFIDYTADVRCLAVGRNVWCMRRESEDWKVNRGAATPKLVDPPGILATWTLRAAEHLGSSIVGLDFLQTREGEWKLLECNDVPGLSGFPDHVREAVVEEFQKAFESRERSSLRADCGGCR